jgi:hypothetical protein
MQILLSQQITALTHSYFVRIWDKENLPLMPNEILKYYKFLNFSFFFYYYKYHEKALK